ncbi:hypothetical protein JXO59_14070 [candidate division KSB1 bacterium]|nr:hypothetical protein [candidate division KSB1 bacterium]
MIKFTDIAVPYVGIELDITLLYHTLRDIFLIIILWQVGYRGFQAALTLVLLSGFFEAGNGICYNRDGSHAIFNPIDILPAVLIGFFAVCLLSGIFDWMMLLYLSLIFILFTLSLMVINALMGRKFYFGHDARRYGEIFARK